MITFHSRSKNSRRGSAGVQVAVALALVAGAVLFGATKMGKKSKQHLKKTTAAGILDPQKLANHFAD